MTKRPAYYILIILLLAGSLSSCDDEKPADPEPGDTTQVEEPLFDINNIKDTYPDLAPLANNLKWGPYNTHDPSVIKEGEYFYSFSTDAAYGVEAPAGIQVRKSKDLIEWKFAGWALNGIPKQGSDFIKSKGGTPFNSLWAPFCIKVSGEFRLYYSLSSAKPRLSVIGLLTSASPEGPWTERGLAVMSVDDNSIQTNAIDPSVIIDKQGQHWMYYGSAWDGIYILRLNSQTGLAETTGDKGRRIAQRGFTGNSINGNIEGPEIIYHPQFDKYYLFIAYDWLETKYNVRVARAESPDGPFYDFKGHDANVAEDHGPMILAPYQFKNHGGWQGTSHVSVFRNNDQFYVAHQGRPGVDKYFMVMHVRKVFWTSDGWPVVSPQRYAGTAQTTISVNELTGTWEHIVLDYRVVPGYSNEQTLADFQLARDLTIHSNGTLNSDAANTWTFNHPWLELRWSNGTIDKVMVERGRDWENKKDALVFSGLNNEGTAVWGKK
jgi:arabinan endo-1,5-alpha-L-arabinosidase